MNTALIRSVAAHLLVFGWTTLFLGAADSPRIHTDRPSPQTLPLPKGDDVFHFVVFGDRTGGPDEGIKVLAQAVEDTNLLDPDLVLTVGDLVNGYNQTPQWMKQMEEYRGTMNKLKMPWFPVAGNHDIYWRGAGTNPEPKPPREHEDHYERHFGPLWYWFEHKKTGFLILFSDEGHPDGRPRDFGDRDQQQISQRQRDWIAKALAEMKHLKHVFVFLHHPFWWSDRYPGSNWDSVHQLLAGNGNVRAVIAGHIHQLRYDGVRDGIGYYALATTGGSLSAGMEYQYFGMIHHFNVVTVRDSGFSMAAIPVGTVFDPRQFTPDRMAEVDAARYLLHDFVSPPIPIRLDGYANSLTQVRLTNTCQLPIDVTVLAKGDKSWLLAPDHRHRQLQPGAHLIFDFFCNREPGVALDGMELPEFELRFDVLANGARLTMPPRALKARAVLQAPASGWVRPGTNGLFVLDGKSACLELDQAILAALEGPFTVELWAKPAAETDGALLSNLKVGGFSLDVAGSPRFSVQTDASGVDARKTSNLKPPLSIKSPRKLSTGEWHHLAGVFDGRQILLYVDGKRVASTNASLARLGSDKALYIGARPSPAWNVHNFSQPAGFWKGSIDDVRVSRGVRYTGDFEPSPKLPSDAAAVVALSNDQAFGPFVPLTTPAAQALVKGAAKLIREAR